MTRIAEKNLSPKYRNNKTALQSNGDDKFCAVIAAQILTNMPLEKVYEAFEKNGRGKNQGTSEIVTKKAYEELGFRLVAWDKEKIRNEIVSEFPGVHKNLKGITSHHPKRFPEAWKLAPSRALLHSTKHAWAVIDGFNHDFSVNNSYRVIKMFEVIPVSDEAKEAVANCRASFIGPVIPRDVEILDIAPAIEPELVEPEAVEPEAVEPSKVLDLEEMPMADLVSIYNEKAEKPVKRFADRKSAVRRVKELLDA